MTGMTADELNAALVDFGDVLELGISSGYPVGSYDLRIVLFSNVEAKSIALVCQCISNLRIRQFGGGLTQFITLRAEDVSANQSDRVRLHISDWDGDFEVDCLTASVEQMTDS